MREFPTPAEILKVFQRNPTRTFRLRELVVELGLRSSQARDLKNALKILSRHNRIEYLKKNHFALAGKPHTRLDAGESGEQDAAPAAAPRPRGPNLTAGRLIAHRDGYGFVVPAAPLSGSDQDIYIPVDGMGSALNGDQVEIQVLRAKADGRREGRIVRVVDRAHKTVVGQFHCGPRYNYVQPFDRRIPFEVVIARGDEWPAGEAGGKPSPPDAAAGSPQAATPTTRSRNRQFGGESEKATHPPESSARNPRDLDGQVVDVEITTYPRPGVLPRGHVVEILGRRDDFGVDVEIMIRKFHLPHRFSADVLMEAEAAPQYIPERDREGRRDFRGLPIVTIDGETAKDFDDAVLVERQPNGNYLLHVHIADVAHYVRPGFALDREARLRGTSVYFPDRAVPMLPLELSNGICSLNPHVDRLVMSALMEFDPQGDMVEYQLLPGIIRSSERLTYTLVHEILSGQPDKAVGRSPGLVQKLELMQELALILNRRRMQRGSIDFDLPEPLIEFDQSGRMVGITRSERNVAHRLIEEFMLAANQAVAGFLERSVIPSLYRIHEKPEARKVVEFEEIAATFGYSLGVELPAAQRFRTGKRDERDRHVRFLERLETQDIEITPRHYQRLTQRLEGKPEERILSYLMLRSLKQARYSEENVGHFALAAQTYTHFTSPIRRYPDLIVHRILKAALEKEGGVARVAGEAPNPPKAAGKPPKPRKHQGSFTAVRPANDRAPASFVLNTETNASGGAFVALAELQALGIATSGAERRAADAERELMEWKKVSFMAQHLGDEFDALIISLIKFGFFVELTDMFVEGFVAVSSLGDDYYVYRERERAIVGQHTRRAFHLGQRIRVRLDRIEQTGNKLEFSVVDEE